MEYLDPKQKRSHEIKLFIGYVLMAILIVFATIVLGYVAFGFGFDKDTGNVVQNGLLFVDSHPESSNVIVNGIDKGQTDVRLVVPSGNYEIKLKRDGYREWNNKLEIAGGEIERIVYPFLFPEKLKYSDAAVLSSKPIFTTQSPDRNWVIVKYADKLNEFVEFNITRENIEPNVLSISPNIINQSGNNHTFSEIEWANDNRRMLIKHDYDGGSEYIIIDREKPAESFNLSQKYPNTIIKELQLRDKRYDRYYILNADGALLSGEFKKPDLTSVADGVVDFHPHGNDIILYITSKADQKDKVNVNIIEKGNKYKLRELPADKKYLMDLAEFDGSWYVVFGASSEKKVYIYIDPFKDLKDDDAKLPGPNRLLSLDEPIQFLSFSANARFIAVQNGSNFSLYDAEKEQSIKYKIDIDLAPEYKAKWMDGHRINVVHNNVTRIFDFDGTNMQELMPAYNGLYPLFDRDYNNVYAITNSVTDKQKSALVHTPLEAKDQ
mgnify:CR=1 FL=1